MLKYVYDIEILLLTRYNIDPYTMESRMSMIDLQTMYNGLETQAKEDAKQHDGNKLLKNLAVIRDILNMMKLPKYR